MSEVDAKRVGIAGVSRYGKAALVAMAFDQRFAMGLIASSGAGGTAAAGGNTRFDGLRRRYRRLLEASIKRPLAVAAVFALLMGASAWLYSRIPTEYAPKEDRGAFFVIVNGPEGASYAYMEEYMDEIERRLMPLVDWSAAHLPESVSEHLDFEPGDDEEEENAKSEETEQDEV